MDEASSVTQSKDCGRCGSRETLVVLRGNVPSLLWRDRFSEPSIKFRRHELLDATLGCYSQP